VYAEFWVSLASLLRSYTAVHGLSGNRQAAFEVSEERILVAHGSKWLDLRRSGAVVNWLREDGRAGKLEFSGHGRLCGPEGEEEMDMAAEAWARELMQ
jgi:hypothetical protein